MKATGVSGKEIAHVLGVSEQRVSHLLKSATVRMEPRQPKVDF